MKKIFIVMLSFFLTALAFAEYQEPRPQIEAAAQEEKRAGSEYFAIQTVPFFLKQGETEGKGDGRIFPLANTKLLAVDETKIQLEITGWKPENVPHVIYAAKGKRIMKALIAKDKAENIQILKAEQDEETGQNWQQVSLTVWADFNSFIDDNKGDLLNRYGDELLVKACASCHSITAHHHLANQWPGIMKSMKRFVSLDDDAWSFLQFYLQYNAKDMVKSEEH